MVQRASAGGDATARQLRSADHGGWIDATQRERLARGAYSSTDRREATVAVARDSPAGRQTRDDASWPAADFR
ncbi:hypothetical protein WS61_08300 [Burkholderia sp. ABCPW 11]|nr:hypothetical protein WS61_08300 [Burkholderia sp. ABCPW 11]